MKSLGIFFDLDGTLIDSLLDICEHVNRVRRDYKLPDTPVPDLKPFIGKGSDYLMKCAIPELVDYEVRIPKGGHTDALVETSITWNAEGTTFHTIGVDSDQLVAATIATEKMLNLIATGLPGKWKASMTELP